MGSENNEKMAAAVKMSHHEITVEDTEELGGTTEYLDIIGIDYDLDFRLQRAAGEAFAKAVITVNLALAAVTYLAAKFFDF